MSTKTNFKRIAVVAVASLGLGVFTSIAPANAGLTAASTATQPWAVTAAYASSANTASQVVGGTVTLTYAETIDTANTAPVIVGNITSSGVGQLTSVAEGSAQITIEALGTTATDAVFPNTGVSRVTVEANGSEAVVTYTVVVSSTTAGTQTLTASMNNASGTPTSSKSATITWIAASATGVNAANSTLYVDTDANCFTDATTSKATDAAAAAAVTRVRVSGVTSSTVTVCLIARDGASNLVPLASTTVVSSLGASQTNAGDGSFASGKVGFDLTSTAGALGTATITAIVLDSYGNVATLATSLTYYGSLSTLALANVGFAATPGGTAPNASASVNAGTASDGTPGNVKSSGIWLAVVGKDATGNVIDLAATPGTPSFTLDSDKVAGAPAAGTSDTLGTTAAMSTGATDISAAVFGSNIAIITCGSKAEKVTVNVRGLTSTSATVTSNDVPVYCSGAVDKVTVTASGTSVNVDVTDANGYPVADGTSVALAASNGSVVAPSAKTTANGKFATAATFIANSTAATSSVTAIVGDKSGTSAAVKGSGTSIEAQIASMLKLINKIMKRLNIR
jgi:hypothetical protein